METLKKYWWVVAAVVLYMLMGKTKKKTKKRSRIARKLYAYNAKRRYNARMKARGYRN
jgi:hypothetical protein